MTSFELPPTSMVHADMERDRAMNVQSYELVGSTFIRKLFEILLHTQTQHIICWRPDGLAFEVKDPKKLETEILPKFFRHARFQSFVRQLNFYNFRKATKERSSWVYIHELFQKARPELLDGLRRKTHSACREAMAMSGDRCIDDGCDDIGSAYPSGGGSSFNLTPSQSLFVNSLVQNSRSQTHFHQHQHQLQFPQQSHQHLARVSTLSTLQAESLLRRDGLLGGLLDAAINSECSSSFLPLQQQQQQSLSSPLSMSMSPLSAPTWSLPSLHPFPSSSSSAQTLMTAPLSQPTDISSLSMPVAAPVSVSAPVAMEVSTAVSCSEPDACGNSCHCSHHLHHRTSSSPAKSVSVPVSPMFSLSTELQGFDQTLQHCQCSLSAASRLIVLFCLQHSPDAEGLQQEITKLLKAHREVADEFVGYASMISPRMLVNSSCGCDSWSLHTCGSTTSESEGEGGESDDQSDDSDMQARSWERKRSRSSEDGSCTSSSSSSLSSSGRSHGSHDSFHGRRKNAGMRSRESSSTGMDFMRTFLSFAVSRVQEVSSCVGVCACGDHEHEEHGGHIHDHGGEVSREVISALDACAEKWWSVVRDII